VAQANDRLNSVSVNVYYHVGHEEIALPPAEEGSHTLLQGPNIEVEQWKRQAKEFRIGSLGFADSFGILLASLIAMPTELGLCRLQVLRGKDLCQRL
jgi:battenin